MKHSIASFLLSLSLFSSAIYSDEEVDITQQDMGSEKMQAPSQDQKRFNIATRADVMGRAKVHRHKANKGHVSFHLAQVQGESAIYYQPQCKEGLSLGLGYSHVGFDWNKNCYFNTDKFNVVSLTLAGSSERLEGWLWNAYATVNWQPDFSNYTDYSTYDFMLWGRYEYCPETLHIHSGFLVQTGMKIDRIWPIIGFDWQCSENLKLNAVFPVNISLVYDILDNWSAALAGRFFNLRYRLGKHERLKEALLEYQNYGLEGAINYEKETLTANVHAGFTFGGEFKISNREHHRKKHFDMGITPYVGGEVAFKF